jgi:hypothetical protein
MKVPALPHPVPATRLRALLEKPGAAVLRRNYVAEAPGHDDANLRNRIRISAVLAVNLTDPPKPIDAPEANGPEQALTTAAPEPEADPIAGSFAKGLEIWLADSDRAVSVVADEDEIAGALAMFDAYLRLSRFQPAFQRLDQRVVGLNYWFREGLSIGIQGNPSGAPLEEETFFDSIAPIPDIVDFREPRFIVRLPDPGLAWFHDLLRSASTWLDDNSYPNILGAR